MSPGAHDEPWPAKLTLHSFGDERLVLRQYEALDKKKRTAKTFDADGLVDCVKPPDHCYLFTFNGHEQVGYNFKNRCCVKFRNYTLK